MLLVKYLFKMLLGTAVVGDAVAAVVVGYEGLLLATVEFALGWIDGVGWGGACIGVFINLFATDIFPTEHAGFIVFSTTHFSTG